MAYYNNNMFPSNLYGSPNNLMNNAHDLCNNMSTMQNSVYGNPLPFSNYGNSYDYGCNYGNYNSSNPFMDTQINYNRDANGNVTSSYSQHPDYLAAGISSLGIIANTAGNVMIAKTQAQTRKQNQMLQNMAYQQQSAQMAHLQERQMNQKNMQDTMGMMMNMLMMQKMMGSLEES